ncbi:hypothetical protein BUZ43_12550 [Staphylococcus haemolyticus]|uniref:hypothetical protein n=1 Tax=Staphylococcus haemolyticus TaxID=1283 RepID=UPI000D1E5C08|nr:hypothetical protein [Staphylococcus haemolyticus]PTK45039.1 hypothetical protein BUZ43_12550 [Staphylococcus haemolyticus]
MDYAHLNLEHFFARNDDLDIIRDRSEFVMINNFTNEMMYRDGEIEGTVDLNQYYYKNRSQEASCRMRNYRKDKYQ